jgi:F-type H+-transporting ATPase subunit epsilon
MPPRRRGPGRGSPWQALSVATSSAPRKRSSTATPSCWWRPASRASSAYAPLITRLKPGKVIVTLPGGEKLDFAVSGGILEVQPQVVTVLTDTAVRAEDIDEAAVRTAKEEAERILAGRGEAMEIAEAQAKLAEVQAQLQALERLRKNLKH